MSHVQSSKHTKNEVICASTAAEGLLFNYNAYNQSCISRLFILYNTKWFQHKLSSKLRCFLTYLLQTALHPALTAYACKLKLRIATIKTYLRGWAGNCTNDVVF